MDAWKVKRTSADIMMDIFGVCMVLVMGIAILFMGVYFA